MRIFLVLLLISDFLEAGKGQQGNGPLLAQKVLHTAGSVGSEQGRVRFCEPVIRIVHPGRKFQLQFRFWRVIIPTRSCPARFDYSTPDRDKPCRGKAMHGGVMDARNGARPAQCTAMAAECVGTHLEARTTSGDRHHPGEDQSRPGSARMERARAKPRGGGKGRPAQQLPVPPTVPQAGKGGRNAQPAPAGSACNRVRATAAADAASRRVATGGPDRGTLCQQRCFARATARGSGGSRGDGGYDKGQTDAQSSCISDQLSKAVDGPAVQEGKNTYRGGRSTSRTSLPVSRST